MRPGKTSVLIATLAAAALAVSALPAVAQDDEEFKHPGIDSPLQGETRGDGTIVLTDEAYCSYLLGSLWGTQQLTFRDLIDRSKKQKRAKKAAFSPATDADTIATCVEVLGAHRVTAPEDDPLAAWARTSPVIPEVLSGLLRDDFVNQPLPVPQPIGDGARSSGFGDVVTPPFILEGATFLAAAAAPGCESFTATLRDARDPASTAGPVTGEDYLYGITPGHYFWDVAAADCEWSVDLVPVDLGPDPDATPVPRVAVPSMPGQGWSRVHGAQNESYLDATQARQALLDAGLTVGQCTEGESGPVGPGRVWDQDPEAGTLLDAGSPVDVFITSDCDIVVGDRIAT